MAGSKNAFAAFLCGIVTPGWNYLRTSAIGFHSEAKEWLYSPSRMQNVSGPGATHHVYSLFDILSSFS
jgi:hypothetical protein